MTVEREEPGVLVAICEGCGDRVVLDDIDQDADDKAIGAALREIGWDRRKSENIAFGIGLRYFAKFPEDLCADCQGDEPKPHPLFGSGRTCVAATTGAFANDPCDEWPRSLVFEALGLRPDCGHPRDADSMSCAHCKAGYPIGDLRAGWRR